MTDSSAEQNPKNFK